jgi:hypothetical protein
MDTFLINTDLISSTDERETQRGRLPADTWRQVKCVNKSIERSYHWEKKSASFTRALQEREREMRGEARTTSYLTV